MKLLRGIQINPWWEEKERAKCLFGVDPGIGIEAGMLNGGMHSVIFLLCKWSQGWGKAVSYSSCLLSFHLLWPNE